jgi:hypothetical protein
LPHLMADVVRKNGRPRGRPFSVVRGEMVAVT